MEFALCQLATGDLKSLGKLRISLGWADFKPEGKFDAPRWDGSTSLRGKILIWGSKVSVISCGSYPASSLMADQKGAEITLEVDERLIRLVRTWFPSRRDLANGHR